MTELGTLVFGRRDPDGGPDVPAPRELVRFTLPRRVYTMSHLEHVVDVAEGVWSKADQLTGYRIVEQGDALRQFTAEVYGLPVMVEVLLGMPGETAATMTEAVRRTLDLDVAVAGYSLGIRAFPYSPLGIRMADQCAGRRTLPGLQSDSAVEPIVLRPRPMCDSVVEYERQFAFDDDGRFRPVYFLSPDLPEDPATIASPNGRWVNLVQMLWDPVPASEYHRVMLPTLPGITEDDNNYADNPFLLRLIELGYTGAFWSHWPQRHEIMQSV